jgi:hypothetical protein
MLNHQIPAARFAPDAARLADEPDDDGYDDEEDDLEEEDDEDDDEPDDDEEEEWQVGAPDRAARIDFAPGSS